MKILVNIDVPNLTQGIEFYCKALGLQHSRTLDNDVAELVGGSSTIYLLEKSGGSPFSSEDAGMRLYQRHWTPVHMDFVVENLAAAKAMALSAGAVCESECVEWRGSRCVTFADPFGHGFCLIEFRSGSYSDTA